MNANKKNEPRNINEINSKSNSLILTREQAYFQISNNLYAQNEVIKVTFNNNRAHHGKTYIYNHDDLYDKTMSKNFGDGYYETVKKEDILEEADEVEDQNETAKLLKGAKNIG